MATRTVVFPNPDSGNVVGARLAIERVAAGATGVKLLYDPGNGDGPVLFDASQITAGARANLLALQAELDTLYKTAKGYV